MKSIIIILIILLIGATGAAVYFYGQADNGYENGPPNSNGNGNNEFVGIPDLIEINFPSPDAKIGSPLQVTGKARGTWYFEASFPLVLTDWDGKIIAQSYATAQGEWMTEEFVPFIGTIEFENPSGVADFTKKGTLIFQKDNPSGLPQYDRAYEMPVKFE